MLYGTLVLTVLGITGVSSPEGAKDKIVIGATKRLTFTGGEAVEVGDKVVWASGARVDTDCVVDSFLDGPQSTVDKLSGTDILIPEANTSAMAGRTWTLCYKFG